MILNYVAFGCDEPGCEVQSELHTDFKEAVAEIKAAGWKSNRIGDKEWSHFCPAHKH